MDDTLHFTFAMDLDAAGFRDSPDAELNLPAVARAVGRTVADAVGQLAEGAQSGRVGDYAGFGLAEITRE